MIVASQAAIKHLPDNAGRIISIGSCLGEQVGMAGMTVYSMSKFAVVDFTKGLARDLGSRGITVSVVQPGPVDTDMNPGSGPQADGMLSAMAIKNYGTGADIAVAV